MMPIFSQSASKCPKVMQLHDKKYVSMKWDLQAQKIQKRRYLRSKKDIQR